MGVEAKVLVDLKHYQELKDFCDNVGSGKIGVSYKYQGFDSVTEYLTMNELSKEVTDTLSKIEKCQLEESSKYYKYNTALHENVKLKDEIASFKKTWLGKLYYLWIK